jgi:flagellar basal-body rod modification protein FlgD
MSVFQLNSITGAGTAAAESVASSLIPKKHASLAVPTAKAAAPSDATDTSSAASSDITSSDFLTLLVSELKNQDPTQPTDPNAYITQLVGVNSLQQLISINSGLTSIETPSVTTPTT